jgi:hypothetical protein
MTTSFRERPPTTCQKPLSYISSLLTPQLHTTHLILTNHLIADDGAHLVSQALASHPQQFTQIELENCRITSHGLKSLLGGLQKQQNLEYLNLQDNDITNDDSSALFALIDLASQCETLKHLNLAKNNLSPEHAEPLASLIKNSKTLKF